MNNEAFDGQILAEKLSKLNNSQQSIESLSRWCISHRKKARQIVETWDRLFNSSQREQRVCFLYLANDILQNSRRKGSEFVNEFWKVLPASLRLVYENGDEHGKRAVTRLVGIWEERKVFGSRGQSLKDVMLSQNPSSVLLSNGKSSNPIKIVKRDAHSVRIKLAVGGLPEKILTAFQSVLDENVNEESALSKCRTAVSHVGKIVEDIENASSQGNQLSSTLVDDLREQDNVLHQCVEQLENAETARVELVSQLREALQEHELKLVVIRSQLQVARGLFEQASSISKRVTSSIPVGPSTINISPPAEAMKVVEQNVPSVEPTNTLPRPPLTQPVVSYAPLRATDEENKKAAAAAVAAKLAASTSSAQMLTSVLSSLVAEEAASMNGSLKSSGFTSNLSIFSPEKRQKVEPPMAASDGSYSDAGGMPYFTPLQQQPGNSMPPTSVQSISQPSQAHSSYAAPPPLPPRPPLSPANPSANQFIQSAGTMVGVMPYGYGANALPPPPPLPPHITMGLSRPAPQQLQPQLQPQQSQEQQSPASGGYYRPPASLVWRFLQASLTLVC